MPTVVDREILGKPKKEKYWVSYIKQRIRKNKNFLGFCSGPTGSAKSYSSIRMCEELDPEFNIDRIVFGGLALMRLINSGTLKKGSAIVFEEAGIELSNKNWQSTTNKMLNYLLQTFRHRNFILIFNSPYMDFVDASTRKLFHAEFRTVGIDFKKNEAKLKPVFLQYNSRLKKFYYHRLKVITPEGNLPVDIWRVAKPSEPLRILYEAKRKKFTGKLNRDIVAELEAVENKGVKKKTLTDVQEDTLTMLREGMTIEKIALKRQRVERVIRETILLIKKKGYKIEGIYELGKLVRYNVIDPEGKEGSDMSF